MGIAPPPTPRAPCCPSVKSYQWLPKPGRTPSVTTTPTDHHLSPQNRPLQTEFPPPKDWCKRSQLNAPVERQTKHQGPVSWRPTTVKWRQFSQFNRHSTIGTRQTEYHEALPSSANDEVRCDCTFADDGNAPWNSVCRVPIVEWQLDCENCSHLTVVGLHDTGVTRSKHYRAIKTTVVVLA